MSEIQPHTLGAYWEPRRENRKDCAQHLTRFLIALSRCSPLYARWFHTGYSRKEALSHAFDFTDEEQAFNLLKPDRQFDDLGFGASLWNEEDEDAGVRLMVRCGLYVSETVGLGNAVSLSVPASLATDTEAVRGALLATISSWSPAWASVCSSRYLNQMAQREGPAQRELNLDWMLYLGQAELVDLSKLAPPINVEVLGSGGVLIEALPRPIEPDSVEDKQCLQMIAAATASYSGFV